MALRQQLAIYERKHKRPCLLERDRWFWMQLARIWKDWQAAVIAKDVLQVFHMGS
jgi:hypothetical protein